MINQLKKVNKIDTSTFALKAKYDRDKSELEKKISDISRVLKETSYNPKINTLATKAELTTVENKIPSVNNLVNKSNFNTNVTESLGEIPSISGLAAKTELTAVENKIPSVSNLVKNSRITEIEKKINEHKHDQYITTSEFNQLTTEIFAENLQENKQMYWIKQILILNWEVLIVKLTQIKQGNQSLKMNSKIKSI